MKVKVAILGSPPFCGHKATLNLNHKLGHDPPCVHTHAERSHTANEVHVRVWWIMNNPTCAESVGLQSVVVEHCTECEHVHTLTNACTTQTVHLTMILHSTIVPTVRWLSHTAAHCKTTVATGSVYTSLGFTFSKDYIL